MGLVVAVGVEGEVAEEFAGSGGDDSDVEVGGDDGDEGSGVCSADSDVVESAGVSDGDCSGFVDDVVSDSVVGVGSGGGGGFG